MEDWWWICLLPFHHVMDGGGRDPAVWHLISKSVSAISALVGSRISTNKGRTKRWINQNVELEPQFTTTA